MLSNEIKKVFRNKFLSEEEARGVVDKFVSEDRSEVQIATLLSLLAVRGSSVEELVGFAKGMRTKTVQIPKPNTPLLDTCGTGGDGKHTFNVSTLSGLLLSACGVSVAKHGNRSITSRCGSADLLEGLGVKLESPVEKVVAGLESVGMAFFFAPLYHPVMKILGPIRKQISIPTLFNSMGPLLNPIQVDYQVMGLYYSDTEKIAQVLQALGIKGGMVVHGHDGMDEISICAPTKITEFTASSLSTYDFDPREYDINLVEEKELLGGDLSVNLKIAREVINPDIPLTPHKWFVIINAAAGIKVLHGVDFKTAIATATETLQSGKVIKKLQAFIDCSQ